MGLNKNYILKKVGKDYSIIPIKENNVEFTEIFNINSTGVLIYQNLEKGKNKEEILEILCNTYNASKETISKDLDDFINELKKHNIYE